LPDTYPSQRTFSLYKNKSGKQGNAGGKKILESLIDYMLCKPKGLLQKMVVLGEHDSDICTCNGSDHHPVSAVMSYEAPESSTVKNKDKDKKPKQIACWEKIDSVLYQSIVHEGLKAVDIQENTIEKNLDNVTTILLAASSRSVPTKSWYPNRNHTPPKEAIDLHRKSKHLFYI
jgi:hypothetical protein